MSTRADSRSRPQLVLPGQVAAAQGPHDLTGMYVAHHAFRRDLDRFATAVRRTPVEDAVVWQVLARRWQRFAGVLHHHHTVEDTAIWPPLRAHVDAADTGARDVLTAMAAEHERLDPLLDECGSAFAAMAASPSGAGRDELADRVTAARRDLLGHLAHEETEALPLVQRHLTAEEWAAAEETALRTTRTRDMAFLLPWAAAGLSDDQRAAAFGSAGPAHGVLLRLTRGRFERTERVAFRHV